jgi:hypothetical protein
LFSARFRRGKLFQPRKQPGRLAGCFPKVADPARPSQVRQLLDPFDERKAVGEFPVKAAFRKIHVCSSMGFAD